MLDSVHKQLKIEKMTDSIKNYNKLVDEKMNDDDYYCDIYQNIIYLRKDVLTLIKYLSELKSNEQ